MSAHGQDPPARIGGSTLVLGLIGWPVAHSLSPAMHNAAAAHLGLDAVYVPFPVPPERLETALRALPALGIRGVNLTVPHKETALAWLDATDAATAAIGAANTVVVADGCLAGHNTDAPGFRQDLEDKGIAVAGGRAAVLGAGGAARAVVYALRQAGAGVTVVARRPEQGVALARALADATVSTLSWDGLATLPPVDLLVNTTPLGMAPRAEASPWPDDLAWPGRPVVYDLVYRPEETRLMRQARAAGLRAENGLGMLLHQGALAFSLWTGRQPPLNVMARALGLASP